MSYCTLTIKILAAIGAINWGLVGGFDFNLVTFIFGDYPALVNFIYILVGVSGVCLLAKVCKGCCATNMTTPKM